MLGLDDDHFVLPLKRKKRKKNHRPIYVVVPHYDREGYGEPMGYFTDEKAAEKAAAKLRKENTYKYDSIHVLKVTYGVGK